jgi:hypothetical protein
MSDALRTATEIVLEPPAENPVEPPEPTDAELAADYHPTFPHSIDPNAEVFFGGELLRYRDAVVKERAQFIAMRRKAWLDRKEREERARIAAIEAEEKRRLFEEKATRGEFRVVLKDALTAYQELQNESHSLKFALVEARADEAFVRTSADPNNAKFSKDLGTARDATLAAEVRLERVTSPLEQAAQALRQAIQGARAAYMYVHYGFRKERLSRAINEFEGLFDKKAFSRRLIDAS